MGIWEIGGFYGIVRVRRREARRAAHGRGYTPDARRGDAAGPVPSNERAPVESGSVRAHCAKGENRVKVTLQIELEGGVIIPVSAEVATLADLSKLGKKLAATPANANKLIEGVRDRKVKALRIQGEKPAKPAEVAA